MSVETETFYCDTCEVVGLAGEHTCVCDEFDGEGTVRNPDYPETSRWLLVECLECEGSGRKAVE